MPSHSSTNSPRSLAARTLDAPTGDRLFGLAEIAPVVQALLQNLAPAERDVDPRVAVPAAGLQKQHGNIGIGSQPVREDAPGRARTHDDVVKLSDPLQRRQNLLSGFRSRKCLLKNVLLDIAEMAQHLRAGLLSIAGGDCRGDRLMEACVNRLALEAMCVLAQAAPAGVALLRAHGIEEREKQRITRGFGDGAVKQRIGAFVSFRGARSAGLPASVCRRLISAVDARRAARRAIAGSIASRTSMTSSGLV